VVQSLLLRVYGAVRGTGFLNTEPGKALFTSAYFAYKRHLEDPYQALSFRHPELFEGGNILDIGANIGYCSVVFARAIKPPYRVYSFEPEPYNFQLLQRTLAKYDMASREEAFQTAVGAEDGSAELWLNQNHHADHRIMTIKFQEQQTATLTVPLVQIDTIVEQRKIHPISFIKVDVQGYETAVCAGMERTLAANPGCVLALEYMPAAMADLGFPPDGLLQWCRNQQLRIYTLEPKGKLHAGLKLPKGEYADLLLSRRELHG
jgi:FkbM family methyltransferase